ncbi:neuroglobin [Anabrus simplex]|uniref:neuroglobin n=1 Tax=Anabrus simplex TaxID=316456 RepID=UPI0034DDA3F7
MGGTASHHHSPRKSVSSGSSPPPITTEAESPPELSDQQKVLLRETWKELEDNIAKVGVITFISLFETHPDVQAVFMPFSGLPLDDLKQSKQLKAHALRVMAFVQKAVARLHEPEKLQNLLQELGKKHHHYGAKQQYVDLIGPQFIQAIQPSLEDRWTPELQQAWAQLFHYIAFFMKASMEEERLAVEK